MMNMGLSCRKGDSRQGTNLNKGQEARKSVVGFRGGDSSDTARTEPVGWGVKGYGTRVRLGSDCPSLSAPGGRGEPLEGTLFWDQAAYNLFPVAKGKWNSCPSLPWEIL